MDSGQTVVSTYSAFLDEVKHDLQLQIVAFEHVGVYLHIHCACFWLVDQRYLSSR